MTKKDLRPGQIIYVDSNCGPRYNCIGVIVDVNFWSNAVKKENILEKEEFSRFDPERDHPFRVLGTRIFKQCKKVSNPNALESGESFVAHYKFQRDYYVASRYRFQKDKYVIPIDVRPLVELVKINNGIVGETFLGNNNYAKEVLSEAEIIYDYLDNKGQFNPYAKHIYGKENLLRLLKQAIPLD